MIEFEFRGEIERYKGTSSWYLVNVPADISSAIRNLSTEVKRGFGSVRVQCRIGETVWKTSVFPTKNEGNYILFIKKDVRRREGVDAGDTITVGLELLL